MSILRTLAALALLAPALVAQQQVQYSYDRAGRLVRADYGGKVITYGYDPAGNRLRTERTAGPVFTSVNSASLSLDPAAPAVIASGYGVNLATGTALATTSPLPTELAGTRVEVTDSQGVTRNAALFYVSPGQINYLIPEQTALGLAQVRVVPAGGSPVSGSLNIRAIAPGIYSANFSGAGVAAAFYLRVAGNGARTQDLLFDPNTAQATPIDLGPDTDAVYLLLFGTGIRGYTQTVTATVGGAPVPVLAAVPQGQFPGEDQVNIGPLPRSLAGRGLADIVLTFDGIAANVTQVHIR
jgi:uncharacterized protein (TIGR03437 family)